MRKHISKGKLKQRITKLKNDIEMMEDLKSIYPGDMDCMIGKETRRLEDRINRLKRKYHT